MGGRTAAHDAGVAAFWDRYTGDGRGALAFTVRHPVVVLRAARDVRRLPAVPAPAPSRDTPAAAYLDDVLRCRRHGLTLRATGAAVLELPERPEDVLSGSSRATLRRKVRAARRRGTTCRPVTDPAEREALLARAHAAEAEHPDPRYRVEAPDNSDLLDHEHWFVTEDAGGRPLHLAVVPVTGDWGVLRYFRTLSWGAAESDARYLASACVAEALVRLGVRHVLDPEPPGTQAPGLRHFQRMVGYRYVRLTRPRKRPARSAQAVGLRVGLAAAGAAAGDGAAAQGAQRLVG